MLYQLLMILQEILSKKIYKYLPVIFFNNLRSRLDFPPAPCPPFVFSICAPLFLFFGFYFSVLLGVLLGCTVQKRGCFSFCGTSKYMYCILCPALCIICLIVCICIQYVVVFLFFVGALYLFWFDSFWCDLFYLFDLLYLYNVFILYLYSNIIFWDVFYFAFFHIFLIFFDFVFLFLVVFWFFFYIFSSVLNWSYSIF